MVIMVIHCWLHAFQCVPVTKPPEPKLHGELELLKAPIHVYDSPEKKKSKNHPFPQEESQSY